MDLVLSNRIRNILFMTCNQRRSASIASLFWPSSFDDIFPQTICSPWIACVCVYVFKPACCYHFPIALCRTEKLVTNLKKSNATWMQIKRFIESKCVPIETEKKTKYEPFSSITGRWKNGPFESEQQCRNRQSCHGSGWVKCARIIYQAELYHMPGKRRYDRTET